MARLLVSYHYKEFLEWLHGVTPVNLREPWQHEQIFPPELATVMEEGQSYSLGPLPSPVLSFCSACFWYSNITYSPLRGDPK